MAVEWLMAGLTGFLHLRIGTGNTVAVARYYPTGSLDCLFLLSQGSHERAQPFQVLLLGTADTTATVTWIRRCTLQDGIVGQGLGKGVLRIERHGHATQHSQHGKSSRGDNQKQALIHLDFAQNGEIARGSVPFGVGGGRPGRRVRARETGQEGIEAFGLGRRDKLFGRLWCWYCCTVGIRFGIIVIVIVVDGSCQANVVVADTASPRWSAGSSECGWGCSHCVCR